MFKKKSSDVGTEEKQGILSKLRNCGLVRKFKSLSKKKKIVVSVVLIAALLGGSWFGYTRLNAGNDKAEQSIARVTRGNIIKSIEGTGTIQAINQYEVTSLVKGEILADYFSEGQEIQEGDLMYTIDADDMTNSIEKAQDSYDQALENYEKTITNAVLRAPISGVITNVYIEDGDEIQNGTKVMDIVNADQMLLKIKFNANDARHIHEGDSAVVNLENSFTSLSGTVTNVGTGSISNAAGVSVTSVEIRVQNPGGIVPGNRATALIGDYACNEAGTFEYSASRTVSAKLSGEVYNFHYREGDAIEAGATIMQIDNDSNAQSTLKQAKLSLDNLNEQLEDYSIKAPISGKVIQKNAKAGEKLDNGSNNSNVMAIIADLSTLTFEINVDELDISSIKEGQSVQITADAISGKTFGGYVENVSIVGTSSNGVTSYPVKIYVNEGEGEELIPGMNVSATIITESREDVLTVPLSAINRGNMVLVKRASGANKATSADTATSRQNRQKPVGMPTNTGVPEAGNRPAGAERPTEQTMQNSADSSKENQQNKMMERMAKSMNIPEGYELVRVEIGLNDDTNVEIISGLNEGDTVLLNETASATTQTNTRMQQGMGSRMPSGMGGGMPGGMGGGMPGGGMR